MRKVRYKTGGHFEVNAEDISKWCLIRHVIDHKRGHRYEALDLSKPRRPVIGNVRYFKDFPAQGVVSFHELFVEPEYRHRGVAKALCIRLHADTPGYTYDPGGYNQEEGQAFIRHFLDTEPHLHTVWHEGRDKPCAK